MNNYNSEIKATIKAIRELLEGTFSNITVASYATQIDLFRAVIKFQSEHGMDTTKECLNILDVAMSATDTDLDDLYCEFTEKLGAIESREDDENLELPCGDVRIIDKEEIDQIWTDSLIETIKECYDLGDKVPSFVEIDWEKTAENCKVDGMGHHFSSYDGEEHEAESVYIFRTN